MCATGGLHSVASNLTVACAQDGITPLDAAAESGNADIITFLGEETANIKELIEAAKAGDVQKLRELVDNGANIEVGDKVRVGGAESCVQVLPLRLGHTDWLVRRMEARRSSLQVIAAMWMPSGTWWRRVPTSRPRTLCV